MKMSMRRYLPVLCLAAAFVAASAMPALAQTRPALVRDVDNGDLSPVRLTISVSINSTDTYGERDGITVPAGKRLVIDNVSIWAFTSSAADKITGVWLSVKPGSNYLLLDPAANEVRAISGGASIAAYNRPVKAYYEAGETLYAQVFADGTTSSKIVNIYLQGHYVTVP